MLVLSRQVGEKIIIGGNITLTVVAVHGDKVRLGIEAPKNISVHREEIAKHIAAQAALTDPAPEAIHEEHT